jgi:uncharacterized membrane protein
MTWKSLLQGCCLTSGFWLSPLGAICTYTVCNFERGHRHRTHTNKRAGVTNSGEEKSMPRTTLAGHPLHVILNDLPMGMLPFSWAMDAMHAATGETSYADAAYYSLVGGYAGALAAAAAGMMDYQELPRRTEVKRTAHLHAGLNIGIMGLMTVNLLLRRDRYRRSGRLPFLLSTAGVAGLAASAWYGSEMVYKHGVRIKGKSPIEHAPELKPSWDEQLVERLERPVKRSSRTSMDQG